MTLLLISRPRSDTQCKRYVLRLRALHAPCTRPCVNTCMCDRSVLPEPATLCSVPTAVCRVMLQSDIDVTSGG